MWCWMSRSRGICCRWPRGCSSRSWVCAVGRSGVGWMWNLLRSDCP
jgi:hypothetical protein